MRREWIEQDQKRAHARNRDSLSRVGERVHENHHLRDRGVEGERFDVFA